MTSVDGSGILRWPVPAPDPETSTLLTQSLNGFAKSSMWLMATAGLWPELDAVREEYERVFGLVRRDIDALNALLARFKAEDAAYDAGLAQATRAGIEPPPDHRTPPEKRAVERDAIERTMWANTRVLAEVADRVRAVLHEHESEWLAGLKSASVEAEEAVREHERLLHDAKVKAWQGVQMGRWLKSEVNGGAFGHQSAPAVGGTVMPPKFDPRDHQDAFERRYFEQDQMAPLPPAPKDDPFGTGVLDADEEAPDSIEPLDDNTRFGAKA